MGIENKAGFLRVFTQLSGAEFTSAARHSAVLGRLNDQAQSGILNSQKLGEVFEEQIKAIDISEAGFQAVQSGLVTAASSIKRGHETTHALLSQNDVQLQQILRNQISFRKIWDSVHWRSNRPKEVILDFVEPNVFLRYYSHTLPIGTLRIRLNRTLQSQQLRTSALKDYAGFEIAVTFMPPWWLSHLMIEYSIRLDYDLNSNQLRWGGRLWPLAVNCNSFFIQAVKSLDVEGVRQSFREGLARPTDYVLVYSTPHPWHEVRFIVLLMMTC